MRIEFEHNGATLVADVSKHAFGDEEDFEPFEADYRYEIRWVDDGGFSDVAELEDLAIAAYDRQGP